MRSATIALAALALCGSSTVMAQTTDTHSVEAGKAQSASLHLSCPAGQFNIKGDGDELFDGSFHYTRPEWQPEVAYRLDGTKGRLTVEVPSGPKNLSPPHKNQWDLTLGGAIPLDVKLEFGAGEGQFDFKGLNLTRLEVDMGAGDIYLDLSDTSVPALDIEAGVGRAKVDLSGAWANDLRAQLKCGIGELVLVLPRSTGVHVDIETGLGHVSAADFGRLNGAYTNQAYGGDGPTLHIAIAGGLGAIRLEEAEE